MIILFKDGQIQVQICTHNQVLKAKHVTYIVSYNHTEGQRQQQRQRPMLVYGDAWKSVPDKFPSVTIDQHWPLTLTLGVVIPLFFRIQHAAGPLQEVVHYGNTT